MDPADIQEILDLLDQVVAKLPEKVNMNAAEGRKTVKALGKKSDFFLNQVRMILDNMPSLSVGYLSAEEFKKDVQYAKDLDLIQAKLEQSLEMVSDTRRAVKDEAIRTGLALYTSWKAAAAMNVPGIDSALEPLRQMMPNSGPRKVKPTPSED